MKSEVIFDLSDINKKLKKLENKTTVESFWNNPEEANSILKKIKLLNKDLIFYNSISEQYEIIEFYLNENINTVESEILEEFHKFKKNLESLEIKVLLNEPDDDKDAILSIHPGAGGKESEDWAFMLYRMYVRWAENNKLDYRILNFQDGDENGVKDVAIEIKGYNIYGQLKSERGIHRLVRISPFDTNSRRHTSFAAVFIDPIIDDDINIEIKETDIKIDTYRASGAGGQHVNKTDSAVRIKHLESGIVVQCQNERSQLKNKNTALKMLRSKLYQKLRDEKDKNKDMINNEKKEIGWGSQIRSYVFHPYNMVKDHRSKYETSNTNDVMNGSIDAFIRNYLLLKLEK